MENLLLPPSMQVHGDIVNVCAVAVVSSSYPIWLPHFRTFFLLRASSTIFRLLLFGIGPTRGVPNGSYGGTQQNTSTAMRAEA